MGAPTPQEHVRHFLSTVEDLERLSETFPISASINLFGHREDDDARWRVIMHALLLRKYFQDRDDLNLSEVAKSVRACVVKNDVSVEEWEALEVNVAELQNFSISVYGAERHQYDDGQILKNELYGRYLHGDYRKWEHTQRVGNRSDNQMLTATLNRLFRVQRFAEFVRDGVKDGSLNIEKIA